MQFQERAVPIGAALAESLGVAESEVKDLVSAGVVGFPEFEKAFNSMSEAGGLFEGAIDKQSQTINGSISTMADNFAILQTEIGKTFAPDVVDGIKLITQSLQDFTGAVVENKDGIAIAIGFVRDYVTVYLNLAATLVKSETPLSKVDAQIEKVALSMSSLAEKKADLESSATARFFSPINLKEVNGLLDKQEKKLASLVAQRNKLGDDKQNDKEIDAISAEFAQFEAEEKAKAPLVAVENAKILEERAKLTSELAVLKEEQLIKEAEAKIAADELGIEGKTLELENVLSHELAKSKITQDAELERNKKIRDAQSKKLADDKTNAKAQIAVTAAEAKAKIAIDLAKAKHDAAMNAGYLKAVNLATSITKEGTAEHKALSIISATISTYTAAARAMIDYPFPANVAVAGLTTIAGLKNVKEITKASFNTGGVVGGFSGATNGLDNTSANVRTGEMILNANQQKQLFDIAAGRGSQASENRLIEITSIVQVDEREIARAVRNQRIEGFA